LTVGYYAAGGYYSAGGFGSFFKKAFHAVSGVAQAVTQNPLIAAGVGLLPGGATILGASKLVNGFLSGGGGGAGPAAAIAGSQPQAGPTSPYRSMRGRRGGARARHYFRRRYR
jgi:hypothetical protein